jgi:hypothetical protein
MRKKQFMTYAKVTMYVPCVIKAYTKEEAEHIAEAGEGSIDLSHPSGVKIEGWDKGFGLLELAEEGE